jgi:hypothetical protein
MRTQAFLTHFSYSLDSYPRNGLTNNIPLHQMKPIQMCYRILCIIWTLINDIGSSFCLQVGSIISQADLPDGTVLSEKVVEVWTGYVEIPADEKRGRMR